MLFVMLEVARMLDHPPSIRFFSESHQLINTVLQQGGT